MCTYVLLLSRFRIMRENTKFVWVCLISFNMWISSIHFLANNIILLCSLSKTLIYITHFLYPFIYLQTSTLTVQIGYCEECCNKDAVCPPSASFMYSEAHLHRMLLLLSIANVLIYILPHKSFKWFLFFSIINTDLTIGKHRNTSSTNLCL